MSILGQDGMGTPGATPYSSTVGANVANGGVVPLKKDASGNPTSLVDEHGNVIPLGGVHPRYFTHLFAGSQSADDSQVYDISGAGGHATRGANLSVSQLWTTNAGYASTLDPSGGAPLPTLVLPALNLDYAGGESLFMWWLGKCTKEGATANLMGDNHGVGGFNGIRVRVASTGALGLTVNEGTANGAIATTTLYPFDGDLHSFCVFLSGVNRTYSTWVDETALQQSVTFSSGTLYDTRTTTPLTIGCDDTVSGSATAGLASATRALVILKLSPTDAVPTDAQLLAAIRQLRAAPHLPLKAGAV